MKRKSTIFIIIILTIFISILHFKISPLRSKENTNVKGIVSSRFNYSSTNNSSVDRYISEMQYQIKEIPNSSSLYTKLGSAYLQKARETGDPSFYKNAQDNLEKSIELDNNSFEAMYQMGVLSLARHQFTEALTWGNKAVDVNPYNGPMRGVIFDGLIELGRYDEAAKTLQTMIDMRPDITSYARVSYYRELKGDLQGAIEAMTAAVNAGAPGSENTAWCRVQLGNLYLNSGDIVKAETEYNNALEVFPNFYQALNSMAKLRFITNNRDASKELYLQSLKINPSAEAMIGLGDLYRITGENEKAEEQYENVRFMNTVLRENGVDVDMELALFEADHNTNLERPLKDAEESLTKKPTIKSYNTLAWIQYRMGNYSEAEKNIQQALKLGTKEPLLYYHAGMIYKKLGQIDKAKPYLEYTLNIFPQLNEIYQ